MASIQALAASTVLGERCPLRPRSSALHLAIGAVEVVTIEAAVVSDETVGCEFVDVECHRPLPASSHKRPRSSASVPRTARVCHGMGIVRDRSFRGLCAANPHL